jgi:hypothetical protein
MHGGENLAIRASDEFARLASPNLQFWFFRLDRCIGGAHTFHSGLAFEDLVAAAHVEFIEVRAAEYDIGQPLALRLGNDAIHATGLIAELDAIVRANIESSFGVERHAIGTAFHYAIGASKVMIRLLGGERAIGFDMVAPDELSFHVCDQQQALIGR